MVAWGVLTVMSRWRPQPAFGDPNVKAVTTGDRTALLLRRQGAGVGSYAVRGVGMSDSNYAQWLWQELRSLLALVADGPVVLSWGEGRGSDSTTAWVRIPKDFVHEPTPAGLQSALANAHDRSFTDAGELLLQVDVIGWVGWLLSRCEEQHSGPSDAHGRFPHDRALQNQAGLQSSPVVDAFVDAIRSAIVEAALAQATRCQTLSAWPTGKRFAVCLSHDIDNAISISPRRSARKVGAAAVALAAGKPCVARRRLIDALGLMRGGDRSPYWLMQAMARRESARGFRSTFFVLPHTHRLVEEGGRSGERYDVRGRAVQRMLLGLIEEGHELGLHTTYDAHETVAGLVQDWSTLCEVMPGGQRPVGARSHYLRFRVPETFRQSVEVGMLYDGSLGWADGWGFRSGTSFPYMPFDHDSDRALPLWETNLHLMDVAVPLGNFEVAVGDLLHATASTGGYASILVHPSPYENMTAAEHLSFYDRVLDVVSGHEDAWVTTHHEVVAAMEEYRRRVSALDEPPAG